MAYSCSPPPAPSCRPASAAFSKMQFLRVQDSSPTGNFLVATGRPLSQCSIQGKSSIPHGDLGDFYKGISSRVGVASLDFYEQMRKEHCECVGWNYQFSSSNFNISTTPKEEWLTVIEGREPTATGNISGHKSLRRRTPANWWHHHPEHAANSPSGYLFDDITDPRERSRKVISHLSDEFELMREEVISIILFTGPMFTAYNSVLSKFPVDLAAAFAPVNFTTTIHTIISAIQKLSVRTPVQSIVYRGTGGRGYLPDCFWEPQEGLNVYGYTEFGVMSMTSSKEVALEYSGVLLDRPHPAVLAFAAGAVDRGASVQVLSQFPREVEFTFPPFSYIQPEFVNGMHRLEYIEHPEKPGVQVPLIYVRVNANIRTPTLDELNSARKKSHIALFHSQNRDTIAEIRSICNRRADDILHRFSGRRLSVALLDELKDAQHATSTNDPVKMAFEGFLSVICHQCEAVLSLHEQKDETVFLSQFGHSRMLNEMLSVRKWAIAKVLWYMEDEGQDLAIILHYPLLKCYREYVSFCRRRIQKESLSENRFLQAMSLCHLLGLVGSADSDDHDSLRHDGSPIVDAVENGISVQDVELMLDAGFSVESSDASGNSLLSIAARYGNQQLLELLITRGANVNSVNSKDGFRTPIIFAVYNNHLNCLNFLLDSGAEPSQAAVEVAVEYERIDCFKALTDAGGIVGEGFFSHVENKKDIIDRHIILSAPPVYTRASPKLPAELSNSRASLLKSFRTFIADSNLTSLDNLRKFTLLMNIQQQRLHQPVHQHQQHLSNIYTNYEQRLQMRHASPSPCAAASDEEVSNVPLPPLTLLSPPHLLLS
jgi:ankyrin repeat protein